MDTIDAFFVDQSAKDQKICSDQENFELEWYTIVSPWSFPLIF